MKHRLAYLLLEYFRFLAKIQLWKIRPLIIGITGSAGKTSVMHAIEAILKPTYSVKVSQKANSQSGLSLNILGISPRDFSTFDWLRMALLAPLQVLFNWQNYQVYIAEMGIDGPNKPSNMEYLLSIFQPSIGVFVSLSSVHAQAFDSQVKSTSGQQHLIAVREAIGKEKVKLLLSVPKGGWAVFNGDDGIIKKLSSQVQASTLTFGQMETCAISCQHQEWQSDSTIFTLSHANQTAQIRIKNYWLPKHYGNSFGAAVAVGLAMKIDFKESCRRIEQHFYLPPGRASIIPAIHNATILDSTYNASSQAMLDFFDMLTSLKQTAHRKQLLFPKRIIGLLGDMREIGAASQAEHESIALRASKVFDEVVLVGPEMRAFALPIFRSQKIPVTSVLSSAKAGTVLAKILRPNDLLFAKGSQNTIFLERTLALLLQHPETANDVLCRTEAYWRK